MAQALSNLLNSFAIVKMERGFNFVIGFMCCSYWDMDGDGMF